ncbi:MAG: hypothetical protein IPO93_02290 [Actinobacteria bacterium]|nr:hypothetical protein [Actinomycetota bacterium]
MTGRLGQGRAAAWPWAEWFSEDPGTWVLAADDPAARWLALTSVMGLPHEHPKVAAARAAVLANPATRSLVERVPDWEGGAHLSGHESPSFAPNLMNLLADMGVRRGDFERVDRALESMLEHQDEDGRFLSYAPRRGQDPPVWGSLPCDSHAIVETLVRYGYGLDRRVRAGLDRMIADIGPTGQGRAWPCRPDASTGFRGPGRKDDCCPQVTVQALRAWGRASDDRHPPELDDAVRVLLGVWRGRGAQKPYQFGHGKGFKTVKWPPTWYRVDAVLDAVSRFPGVWLGPTAAADDHRSVAELTACLLAYNVDGSGRVVPHSTYRGFDSYEFGQKKNPSAFATARILAILRPFACIAADIRQVDVTRLSSSKGGTGAALPP